MRVPLEPEVKLDCIKNTELHQEVKVRQKEAVLVFPISV